MAPAVSPSYDLGRALAHVELGIWNFYSSFDLLFLGVGTLILGTMDGRHVLAAGARGFTSGQRADDGNGLRQQPYVAKMLRSWNYGGHFGCTNRVFVAEWLAPLLRIDEGQS